MTRIASALFVLTAVVSGPGCSSVTRGTARPESFRSPIPAVGFGSVQIDPVACSERAENLENAEQAELVRHLQLALERELAPRLPIAAGAPLVVRAVIVAVDKSSPRANAVSTLLLGAPVNLGGVVVEIEAVVVDSGERVASARYVEPGRPWHFRSSFSALAHARQGLDRAAVAFAGLLFAESTAVSR